MQMGSSVCLSVCQMRACEKVEERFVQIFTPYERPLSLVFWKEEWLLGMTLSTWSLGSFGTNWSEIADFQSVFAHTEKRRRWRYIPHEDTQSTLDGRGSYVVPTGDSIIKLNVRHDIKSASFYKTHATFRVCWSRLVWIYMKNSLA